MKLCISKRGACPAVKYGWLYTKSLEREKSFALKRARNYEAIMSFPQSVMKNIFWWKHNINTTFNNIRKENFTLEIFTDSSKTEWDANRIRFNNTHGFQNVEEWKYYLNYLKLLTTYYALKSFARDIKDCIVPNRVDKKTAITYIIKMGAPSQEYWTNWVVKDGNGVEYRLEIILCLI